MSGLTDLASNGSPELSDLRIAVPVGWVADLDSETQEAWDRVSAGLPEILFPDRLYLENLFQPIFFVEAAAYHREWIEAYPDRYGTDVLGLLRRGLQVSGVDYVRAVREREAARAEVEAAMRDWDAILLPTTACVAPLLGATHVREKLLRFTRPFSYTGQPVITIPAPVSGLPVGIQVVGHFSRDADLIRVARSLELAWQQVPAASGGP
jgi:aspartyl-tRNA(Asn)/glutamyl-tRNA(Gln) amidotransferase subunit A